MIPLWTQAEVAAATGAVATCSLGPITGVSIDTRTLQPGDLFFAIRGEARDGHDFVEAALERGAAAAVVSRERAEAFGCAAQLLVADDVLEALRQLGCAARRRSTAGIVAVTGSVGKTGTKEALRLVLARHGPTHASAASYNNHWGVPLTLARMPRQTAFGVFEIGMNHMGEIAPLARMVRPQVALITTVEPVHIEFFRSLAGIADAKGEIFAGLELGGTAVINRDNPHFERLRAHALASPAGRVLSFGEHREADLCAERIVAKPDSSLVEARLFGRALRWLVGMPGRHIALNSLGVVAAAWALGVDPAVAGAALAELAPPRGRGERLRLVTPQGAFLLIDESYNANPASMRAALAALGATAPQAKGRRIAVLGDMLELGEAGPAMHRDLAAAVAAAGIDLVFAAGPLMRELWNELPQRRRGPHAATAAELEAAVIDAVQPGDVVMAKGSNGTRLWRLVEALKQRYGGEAAAAASNG